MVKSLLRLESGFDQQEHCCTSTKTGVQSPRALVKSWEQPHSPVTPGLHVQEDHRLAGYQPSSRFNVNPCFKGIKQRIIGQGTPCLTLSFPCTQVQEQCPPHSHIPPTHSHIYTRYECTHTKYLKENVHSYLQCAKEPCSTFFPVF